MSKLEELEKNMQHKHTKQQLFQSLGSTFSLGMHELGSSIKSLLGGSSRTKTGSKKVIKNQITIELEKYEKHRINKRTIKK